jgi:hypothetical protein
MKSLSFAAISTTAFSIWYYKRMNTYHPHKLKLPFVHYNFYQLNSWTEEVLLLIDKTLGVKEVKQIVALINALVHRADLTRELLQSNEFWTTF